MSEAKELDTRAYANLVDIIDMQPERGEYAGCQDMHDFEVFGEKVRAFTKIHAQRLYIQKHFNSSCARCNHGLRYCHIIKDGERLTCVGRECMYTHELGPENARKLRIFEAIKDKKSAGYCVTGAIPNGFWNIPKENRPVYARPWKVESKDFSRSMRAQLKAGWYLTIRGATKDECYHNALTIPNFTL